MACYIAEFGVNKAIATQLWERMSWQGKVINLQRPFSMPYPGLGIKTVHLEEMVDLLRCSPLGNARARSAQEMQAGNDPMKCKVFDFSFFSDGILE